MGIVAAVAILVSGCAGSTGFPAVHDMPAARLDSTLTPDQVKQASDNLAIQRDHLNVETQAVLQGLPPQPPPPGATQTAGASPKP